MADQEQGMGVSSRRRTGRLSMRWLFLRRGMGVEGLFCLGWLVGVWCLLAGFSYGFGLASVFFDG